MNTNEAIKVANVHKKFKDNTVLKGINFSVQKGSIFALLGANGAGKSTMVNILSTLLKVDEGDVFVHGLSVTTDAKKVRELVSLTGQFATVDDWLTGRENLALMGELSGLTKTQVKTRAVELLQRFDLTKAADLQVATYSGGMRRKLDVAASLMSNPSVIYLDEPTTGLDPRSRRETWQLVKDLAKQGTTILLTTQYLEEADQLADDIAVLHKGTIVARGTADELKQLAGKSTLDEVFIALTKPEEE